MSNSNLCGRCCQLGCQSKLKPLQTKTNCYYCKKSILCLLENNNILNKRINNMEQNTKETPMETIDSKCRSVVKKLTVSQDQLLKKIATFEHGLQREPMTSEQQDKLFEALCKAKAKMNVDFEKTGTSNRGYFATYSDLVHHAKPLLAAEGIDIIHEPIERENQDFLKTTITHTSGQWRSSVCAIRPNFEKGSMASNHAYAGALTSMKRYVYAALLNLHTGGDKE